MVKNVPPKCPHCGRLTVDNVQHCKDKSTSAWAETCGWMRCKCKHVYGVTGQIVVCFLA